MNCISCSNDRSSFNINSKIVAHATQLHNSKNNKFSISNDVKLLPIFSRRLDNQSIKITSQLSSLGNLDHQFKDYEIIDNSTLKCEGSLDFNISNALVSSLDIKTLYAEKLWGGPLDFSAYEKLYPIEDISFIDLETGDNIDLGYSIYSLIDEGVLNADGSILSDNETFSPSDLNNNNKLQYKFKVTKPATIAKLSYLALRILCNFKNYAEKIPDEYKIYAIQLKDPNGKLIIEYNDIIIKGDNYYTTYIAKPKINNLLLGTWEEDYPSMDINGDYTLTLNFDFRCLSSKFEDQFELNFKSCIELEGDTPFKNLKISALEIGNSGTVGLLSDLFVPMFNKSSISDKISQTFLPNALLPNNFQNGIYPESNSIWQNYPLFIDEDISVTNETPEGLLNLVDQITSSSQNKYIRLLESSSHQDSGRLLLTFDNTKTKSNALLKGGQLDKAFTNSANYVEDVVEDLFFDVYSIHLVVVARKSSVSCPDFSIDVVGYSDDKLLHVTSPVGGFLQNISSLDDINNNTVYISGINNITQAISENSISDDADYYEKKLSVFGDHYTLTTNPIINSLNFQEYKIPLEIKYDPNKIGKHPTYSLSRFLDNLHIDICPIPVGADIAHIKLVVQYNPSNALELNIIGQPSNQNISIKNSPIYLLPSGQNYNTQEQLSNFGPGLTTPSDIKTNYSRRWRGVNDSVGSGAFDILSFQNYEFEFEYPTHPFLYGYVDFSNYEAYTNNIKSTDENVIAEFISSNYLDDYLYHNIGWRLSNQQLFGNVPSTPYKSISWRNNIYDSFDRAVRVNTNDYISLGPIELSTNGWAIFLRFTPDNIVPNNQSILSKGDSSNTELQLKYTDGYLSLEINNTNITITDTNYWSDYQYPLSVLITYNDDGNQTYKLYTDNELISNFNNLVAESIQDTYTEYSNNLNIGHCENSNTDLPIFVHEFGISKDKCNIVSAIPNRINQEINVEDFFKSHRMHYISDNTISTYIDDDIYKWNLGSFKSHSFSPSFNRATTRDGTDYLIHKLAHDGSQYSCSIEGLTLPSYASNVSYHTQIENDFLRFNIGDISQKNSKFYSIPQRISVNLPKGYTFKEEAICVDTIIDHETTNPIIWEDGSIGPKLIVSLYSPSLNDQNRPSKDFGLISRDIHNIEPSGGIIKLTSKFTYNSLFDTSESWALFDREAYLQEFEEKYFSNQLDDMFLQYDLVYPTGNSINSVIKIYSANVRLDDVLVEHAEIDNLNFSLFVNSDTIQEETLSFFQKSDSFFDEKNTSLFITGNSSDSNSLAFYLGCDLKNNLGLFTRGKDFIGLNSDLFGSSSIPTISLFTSGNYVTDGVLPFYINGEIDFDENDTSLYIIGRGEDLFLENQSDAKIGLYISAFEIIDFLANESISLYSFTDKKIETNNSDVSLYINGYDPSVVPLSGNLSLFTLNYAIPSNLRNQSESINWNYDNLGENVLLVDQEYITIDQDDNIRGVDIMCYGKCNDPKNECSESVINIHGTNWYGSDTCVEGGIFRAKQTYTNLTFESGIFKSNNVYDSILDQNDEQTVFYSGHFYGIKKYTGLGRRLPYIVEIDARTGSTELIDIPKQFTEVEYNQDETDSISNNESTMNYAGLQIHNNTDIGFGKSISSKDNLIAIGAPYKNIEIDSQDDPGETVTLENAGTVYIYRREDRPEGYVWPTDNFKSSWNLEEALTLPTGFLQDYSLTLPEDVETILGTQVQKVRWFVGQEGREFGHSLDLAINHNVKSLGEESKQTLIVGAPSAKWSRSLKSPDIETKSICLCIFTDKFEKTTFIKKPNVRGLIEIDYTYILEAIQGKDLFFEIFANPNINFDVHIILFIANKDDPSVETIVWNDAPNIKPLHIHTVQISRNRNGIDVDTDAQTLKIKTQMLNGFNNIFGGNNPSVLSYYVDNSASFGGSIINPVQPALNQFLNEIDIPFVEYVIDNETISENWILLSNNILDDLLDSSNLLERNFFPALGIESIQKPSTSDPRFVIPPESGGRAYIFEKESGSWNLIQEIKSPNITFGYPDRFGHAVSFSDNGEVIAIGSPYIDEALSVFEYNPQEKNRYYDLLHGWVQNNRSNDYPEALRKYENDNDIYSLYLALSKEDKFKSRVELQISEYQKIHTLGYGEIQPIGTWSFIANEAAPTPRLGYSVDVNEDGSVIVVGAPTDSMNLYNDADVYYSFSDTDSAEPFRRSGGQTECDYGNISYNGNLNNISVPSWPTSINAGSIYVLESRKYYPHDTVMEYGRFGNLHRRISESKPDYEDLGGFDNFSNIFYDKLFIKTDQVTNDIPNNVGLLFIITPELDVLSDEVVDNIIQWLSLGDRNLVLVGDDPVWEDNKVYAVSNQVINKLLRRLNSRMQIMPASKKSHSLPSGYTGFDNVLPCYVPYGTTSTFINKNSILRASGVADIRMYYDDDSTLELYQSCREISSCADPYIKIQIQDKCEMPLKHLGDLRAEWEMHCCGMRGEDLIYYNNWPLFFGTYTPNCGDEEIIANPFANHEVIPVLTAAEKVKLDIEVPPVPAKYNTYVKYKEVPVGTTTNYNFGSPSSDVADFIWTSGIEKEFSGAIFDYTNVLSNQKFFVPEGSGLLKSNGQLRLKDVEYEYEEILDTQTRYCVSENKRFGLYESTIILLANITGESADSLDGLTGVVDRDKNIAFYANLATTNNGKSLAQLSFAENDSKPSSFSDAYSSSIIAGSRGIGSYITIKENVSLDNLLNGDEYNNQKYLFDVAWISNLGKYDHITELQANKIKNWLESGKKTLIITYDFYYTDEDKANNLEKVTSLCNLLGLSMKPFKSSYTGTYKNDSGGSILTNINNIDYIDIIHPYHPISGDPIKTKTIAYQSNPIKETLTGVRSGNYWYMNAGTVKASFSVEENTGYRLFFTTTSDTDNLTQPITVNIGNAVSQPRLPSPELYSTSLTSIVNYEEQTVDNVLGDVLTYSLNSVGTTFVDIQTGDNQNSLDLYFSSNIARLSNVSDGSTPTTIKLMAVSGVQIPVVESINVDVAYEYDGTYEVKVSDEIPGYTDTIEFVRTIQSDNTKYCTSECLDSNLGNQFIEDGPIVVAQEIEFVTNFEAGYKRSRITVISDASLIQGNNIKNNPEVASFLRSLYPETEFNSQNSGRQFVSMTKLISPERGSVVKYLSHSPELEHLNELFHDTNAPFLYISKDKINENESDYDPKLIVRQKSPWYCETDGDMIEEIRNSFVSGFFKQNFASIGSFSRFSGIIDGTLYIDNTIAGGLPDILKDKGYDYIDFNSSNYYPGDLFGYSVAIKDKTILVGSPFSAFGSGEDISKWNINSELYLGENGGPGAVYMFEKPSGWECTRKLRPNSLMGQLSGINKYSDEFGSSVSITKDVLTVGAPKHDYISYYDIANNSGGFLTKSFNESFNITKRTLIDCGLESSRALFPSLTHSIDNIGAIYSYENKIVNWENKIQNWTLIDKTISNNINITNDNANENFGKSIHLTKPNRTDGDYIILASYQSGIYTKDIMLRNQPPVSGNPDTWMNASVFGIRGENDKNVVSVSFTNSNQNNFMHTSSGIILSNINGEIFLEVSGQDLSNNGFIAHRPYVKSIAGFYQHGVLANSGISLYIEGGNPIPSSQISLFTQGE